MTLPIDQTALNAAAANQVPSMRLASALNIAAIRTATTTIDELYNYTLGLIAGGVLQPYPAFFSRQAIINGNFDVWQRGTSFTNPGGSTYTVDRFKRILGGFPTLPANIIHSKQTLTSGDIVGAYNFYRISPDGVGAVTTVNDAYAINQSIENGNRNLCGNGKKVTASFWARSSIANKKIGVRMYQSYGTGGSPSAIEILNGSKFTLTSTWTKYSVTFTTNTLVGKTFGTNGDDYLALDIGFLWGTSIGVQYGDTVAETFVGAGNIDIAQVQVSAGDQALPFQPRSYNQETMDSLRYRWQSFADGAASPNVGSYSGYALLTNSMVVNVKYPVPMRTTPTITLTNNGVTNQVRKTSDNTSVSATPVSYGASTNKGFSFINFSGTPLTAGQYYDFDIIADSEL